MTDWWTEWVIDCLAHQSLMPTAPTYLAANIQLVSKRGRYHLSSSSYRTLAVPRTRTTLCDRSFAVAGPRAYRILYDRSPATDSLGNIRKHIYSRPRNRSALWLLIIVCYTNNLPYLLTCVDRARSVRSRTTGSASEDRRSAPSRTRNRAQTTCRVLVYDTTPLRRTRNDRRRCVSLHTLLAVRIYSLHVANRCSFSSIIFTYLYLLTLYHASPLILFSSLSPSLLIFLWESTRSVSRPDVVKGNYT